MSRAAQDLELIRRIVAGEEAALRALLAAHQARVYRFALRLVGNAAVAEEVMNEVFLEVWRNAGKFEGASAPSTWILSIAHHRAVSRLRKRREQSWDEDAADALADAGDDSGPYEPLPRFTSKLWPLWSRFFAGGEFYGEMVVPLRHSKTHELAIGFALFDIRVRQ